MNQVILRALAFRGAACLLMLLMTVSSDAGDDAPAGEAGITFESTDNGVDVLVDGKLFTRYQEQYQNKPILHPIIGPSGKEMTRPLGEGDHPHHASFWFTHGDVNGIDFWHKKGTITHQEYLQQAVGDQAVLKAKADWKNESGEIIGEEVRSMTFHADDDVRWIDVDLKFTAVKPVTFGKTKEGAFGVRVRPTSTVDKGGTILNSEGDKNKDAWGKAAAWVDYYGSIDGETLGIAVMNHPDSLRHPTPWHVRTYGLFAANPFMKEELNLAKGESFTLRHRLVFHAGTTEEADIAAIYDDYVKQK